MISREWMEEKQSGGNGEKGGTQKNKKRMVSRSKSRKTIGPCSSSAQASTFRRFPMSPLEQREGRSLWVMRGMMSVGAGEECAWSCASARASARASERVGVRVCKRSRDGGGRRGSMWRWVCWNGVMDGCPGWRTATWTQSVSSPTL